LGKNSIIPKSIVVLVELAHFKMQKRAS